jgi:hypothetical protein
MSLSVRLIGDVTAALEALSVYLGPEPGLIKH